ncbi:MULTISPECIES: hypothetical protein [Bacillus]|uniref:hypothetical protein n=1 Tax=Bacillus TaxID=1386 RepID=UPI0003180DFB|nr:MULTISPECIES: hypothetical protein [Bacillus]
MSQLKNKYKKNRKQFKTELLERMNNNRAFAMLIIETYTAWHHRRHITKIWAMFRNPEFKVFQDAYTKNLFGKHLTGRDDIWRSLYFADKELHDKYKYLIPEVYAMGDALAVAYRILKSK